MPLPSGEEILFWNGIGVGEGDIAALSEEERKLLAIPEFVLFLPQRWGSSGSDTSRCQLSLKKTNGTLLPVGLTCPYSVKKASPRSSSRFMSNPCKVILVLRVQVYFVCILNELLERMLLASAFASSSGVNKMSYIAVCLLATTFTIMCNAFWVLLSFLPCWHPLISWYLHQMSEIEFAFSNLLPRP